MSDGPAFSARRMIAAAITVIAASLIASATVRTAVLAPAGDSESVRFASMLSAAMPKDVKITDPDLALTAFRASEIANPYNMTTAEARNAAAAIGCEFLILVQAATVNRYSLARKEYFESYAAVFVVSARTGRLVDFSVSSFNGFNPRDPEKLLAESIPATAARIAAKLTEITRIEIAESNKPLANAVPEPDSSEARGYRSPLPYRRLSPPYAELANLYAVTATVDIEVELDAAGKIVATSIVRWAGFGLDESVEKAVRSMNWRPAERFGKAEPVRFVLRYNFRKVVKEEN